MGNWRFINNFSTYTKNSIKLYTSIDEFRKISNTHYASSTLNFFLNIVHYYLGLTKNMDL